MFTINGTAITLTRGDTFKTQITIYDGDTEYTPGENDTLTFGIKRALMTVGGKEYVDISPLIEKAIPIDTMILTLLPGDTSKLPFGHYKYDIELIHSGEVSTIINNGDFIIAPEVLHDAQG